MKNQQQNKSQDKPAIDYTKYIMVGVEIIYYNSKYNEAKKKFYNSTLVKDISGALGGRKFWVPTFKLRTYSKGEQKGTHYVALDKERTVLVEGIDSSKQELPLAKDLEVIIQQDKAS